MSTWTSDALLSLRRPWAPGVAALCLMVLGGCLAPGDAGARRGFAAPEAEAPAPVRRIAFYDGQVVVDGPAGYCVDTGSVRRRGASRFVLLARCTSLGAEVGEAADPAVITVSVLPFDARAEQPVAAALAAAQAPARVLEEIDGDGVALVHLADGGDAVVPGGDPRHWRAGMVINGHLVGIAAYAEAGGVVAGPAGRGVLVEMAERMRMLSPRMREDKAPSATAPDKTPDAPARKPSNPAKAIPG